MVRVCILDLGRLECDRGWQVAVPHPSTISDPHPERERMSLPVIASLVESRGKLILFDTGCHPNAMRGHWSATWADYFAFSVTPEQGLVEQLALAGHAPDEVTDVVLSHLHMDHSGNVGLFPDAKIWVHRREVEFALAECLTVADYVGPYVSDDWLLPGVKWQFVQEHAAVTSEVSLIALAGHTPGTLGMQVEAASRTFVFPSDAMYAAENLGPPVRLPGSVYDSLGFRKTAEWLMFMRDSLGALIVFPHDPEQFASLSTAPYWYEA
jgi:glyoxylase-like metal-dependent hydrolase (beta-lactamase superfamily II)